MLRPYLAEAPVMKLLIAGGGTGGHVFPALAIAREWMSRGKERDVVLVGTQRGIEMKLVPQARLPLETLRVAGLKGKGGRHRVPGACRVFLHRSAHTAKAFSPAHHRRQPRRACD